jgi:hypothetical protein
MRNRPLLFALLAVVFVAGATLAARALNPQPLPPGIYFGFAMEGEIVALRQDAVVNRESPRVLTSFAYRTTPPAIFEPPDPCLEAGFFGPPEACVRGAFDVSAPNVTLVRAAGLATAVGGAACLDESTVAAALEAAGAKLTSYTPPDPCFSDHGGDPAQLVAALDGATGALGTGGDVRAVFDQIVTSLISVSTCSPPTNAP